MTDLKKIAAAMRCSESANIETFSWADALDAYADAQGGLKAQNGITVDRINAMIAEYGHSKHSDCVDLVRDTYHLAVKENMRLYASQPLPSVSREKLQQSLDQEVTYTYDLDQIVAALHALGIEVQP